MKFLATTVGLGLALSSSFAIAQLPSINFEPINRIGRTFGFGLSDGYHECQPMQLYGGGSVMYSSGNLHSSASLPMSYGMQGSSMDAWGAYNQPDAPSGSPSNATPIVPPSRVTPIPMQQPQSAPPSVPKPPAIYSQPMQEPLPQNFVPLAEPPASGGAAPRSNRSPSGSPPRMNPEMIPAPLGGGTNGRKDTEEMQFEEDYAPEGYKGDEDALVPDEARRVYRQRTYRNANQQIYRQLNRYSR